MFGIISFDIKLLKVQYVPETVKYNSYLKGDQSEQTQFYSQIIYFMQKQEEGNTEKHPLEVIIGKKTKFITNDGRVFIGVLKGLDQALNCILADAEERVYSQESAVSIHPLGTYFVRGDSILALGEFEETEEEFEQLQDVKAKPLTLQL